MPQASLFHCFENAPDHEIRGVAFTLPRESIREQTLFPHQQDAVDRVIANEWSSGILHLPTGSGKTRVGIELAARLLHDNRENRIIWATHPRILVRQGMARMAELGGLFPTGTKVKWITSGERSRDLFSEAQVLFVMREDLVNLMGCAHDGRYMQEPISEFLGRRRGQTLTVIYDECHQLGASWLQEEWEKFHAKVRSAKTRWRTIGLSATPLPTDRTRWDLLREVVFPLRDEPDDQKWGVKVHKRVANRDLVDQGVICPIDLTLQNSGAFEIPAAVSATTAEVSLPRHSKVAAERETFAMKYNSAVMASEPVLAFLAGQIAAHWAQLGKTLLFAPNIRAANRLVAILKADPRIPADRVFLVHSCLDEFVDADVATEKDQTNAIAPMGGSDQPSEDEILRQIQGFRSLGDAPCILVNVSMLTTGFDDPKIRTVILARLTFSLNLFWQMVGRGTRGPKAGGTVACQVIDPIQLVGLHGGLEEYRPDLTWVRDPRLPESALDPRIPVKA